MIPPMQRNTTQQTPQTLARLKAALQRHGITQQAVAVEAKVGRQSVCHVFAGRAVSRNVVDAARRLLCANQAEKRAR